MLFLAIYLNVFLWFSPSEPLSFGYDSVVRVLRNIKHYKHTRDFVGSTLFVDSSQMLTCSKTFRLNRKKLIANACGYTRNVPEQTDDFLSVLYFFRPNLRSTKKARLISLSGNILISIFQKAGPYSWLQERNRNYSATNSTGATEKNRYFEI